MNESEIRAAAEPEARRWLDRAAMAYSLDHKMIVFAESCPKCSKPIQLPWAPPEIPYWATGHLPCQCGTEPLFQLEEIIEARGLESIAAVFGNGAQMAARAD